MLPDAILHLTRHLWTPLLMPLRMPLLMIDTAAVGDNIRRLRHRLQQAELSLHPKLCAHPAEKLVLFGARITNCGVISGKLRAKKGDFDGDGKTDFAVWRPPNAVWYIINSAAGTVQTTH